MLRCEWRYVSSWCPLWASRDQNICQQHRTRELRKGNLVDFKQLLCHCPTEARSKHRYCTYYNIPKTYRYWEPPVADTLCDHGSATVACKFLRNEMLQSSQCAVWYARLCFELKDRWSSLQTLQCHCRISLCARHFNLLIWTCYPFHNDRLGTPRQGSQVVCCIEDRHALLPSNVRLWRPKTASTCIWHSINKQSPCQDHDQKANKFNVNVSFLACRKTLPFVSLDMSCSIFDMASLFGSGLLDVGAPNLWCNARWLHKRG